MSLRFRQIHLDFHTSEKIAGVGDKFDAAQFQGELQRGHVDSITIFSKCHHGLSYHDTAVGVRHPGMTDELMVKQIEACRAIDVKTPIYISAGLDEAMAYAHPEWTVKHAEGKGFDPLRPGFKLMCFNSPYLDYLCAQIEEVVENHGGNGYGADHGIFLDIISAPRCYCTFCIADMDAQGLDPKDEDDRTTFAYATLNKYYERTTASSKKGNPDRKVFHNSGHIPKGAKAVLAWNSHLELESLPTGGWGYDHFPISAKYVATTGYDFLGMTGKFHTTWGEFGGFKRPNALRYECSAMQAFGSKCSIGDQLHPSGEMNTDTYACIGAAYAEVEEREPWCDGVTPVSEIALVSIESLRADRPGGHGQNNFSEEGAARMLLELHYQFDVIDLDRDLTPYKLVILPDDITLEGAFLDKVRAYRAGGGKLILSAAGGMTPDKDGFALDLGLALKGRSPFSPEYLIPTGLAPTPLVRGPFVIHSKGYHVEAPGTQVLANRAEPFFNREYNHFCSHQHAPDAQVSEFPAAFAGEGFVYFAHEIFTAYRTLGQPLYRDLVADALQRLLPEPVVETNLPTAARVSLMHQAAENRSVLHLLFAVPVKRGADSSGGMFSVAQAVEVIEDLYPLNDIEVTVRPTHEVGTVRLVPSGEELPFAREGEAIRFTVPRLLCHQMVELA